MRQLEQVLISVWRQALIDGAKYVEIDTEQYPVRTTSKRRLKQVDFRFEGRDLRGLEQNPLTKSRWAQMARSGKKVMQFLSEGRYVANVVDGKVNLYGGWRSRSSVGRPSNSVTPIHACRQGVPSGQSYINLLFLDKRPQMPSQSLDSCRRTTSESE